MRDLIPLTSYSGLRTTGPEQLTRAKSRRKHLSNGASRALRLCSSSSLRIYSPDGEGTGRLFSGVMRPKLLA